MVVPIREVVNKHPFTSAFSSIPLQMARIPAYEAIDVNNYDNVRERTTSPSIPSSRSTSVTSNASSIPYHEKMEINNNLPDKEIIDSIDSSQLSYQDNNGEDITVSEATDNSSTRNPQYVLNKAPALKNTPKLQGKSTLVN